MNPWDRETTLSLTWDEIQLLTCALAGNHPESLADLRPAVIRKLFRASTQMPAHSARPDPERAA